MSDGPRIPREQALVLASAVVEWLRSSCQQIEIAGSIRRERETVGDIEIVCLPHTKAGLDAVLENMLEAGTIKLAKYRFQNSFRTRWGERLKCFTVGAATVELSIGDSDNFGYLLWLRTGPAKGNKFVVTRMKVERSAMRFERGYGWLVRYVDGVPKYEHKLSLPDETTVFHALALPEIEPKARSEAAYRAAWVGVQPRYVLDALKVESDELKQKRLF